MNFKRLKFEENDLDSHVQLHQDFMDVVSIHPSQIDEVIQFLLAHKKQVEELEKKE